MTTHQTQELSLIRFAAGGQVYGLSMDQVQGIDRAERLRPAPPDALPSIIGVLPRRGRDIPVVRLTERLGLAGTTTDLTGRIVLLTIEAETFGVLVDRVFPATTIASHELEAVPTKASALCQGLVLADKETVLVLDANHLTPERANWEPIRESNVTLNSDDSLNQTRSNRLVIFGLPSRSERRPIAFGLPGNQVVAVIESMNPTRLPGAPSWTLGLIRWRDRAIPLLDPVAWLGMSVESVPQHRVVIARTSQVGKWVALMAGEVVRLVSLPVPHVPSRRKFNHDPARVLGVYELMGLTLVLPGLPKLS